MLCPERVDKDLENQSIYTLHDQPVTEYPIAYRGDEYRFKAEF